MNANKIIISSESLRRKLHEIQGATGFFPAESKFSGSKKGTSIFFNEAWLLPAEVYDDFEITLYRKPLEKLYEILKMVPNQPVTLSFEDSESFNIQITSMYL